MTFRTAAVVLVVLAGGAAAGARFKINPALKKEIEKALGARQ